MTPEIMPYGSSHCDGVGYYQCPCDGECGYDGEGGCGCENCNNGVIDCPGCAGCTLLNPLMMVEERLKHELQIKDFKSGTGFQANCACGASIQRSRGCNRAGYWYARQAADEKFAAHIKQAN